MFQRVFIYWTRRSANEDDMAPIVQPPTSSPLSSPDSYRTATATPSYRVDVSLTNISSPAESESSLPYRNAAKLPADLREHCRIYLEENLHLITLNLLNSLLSSRRDGPKDPAHCPPPNQLSLLNTIIVHPDFTTRPQEPGWPEVASESLVYLRSILSLFGPINGHFKQATTFSSGSRASREPSPDSDSGRDDADEEGEGRLLSGKYPKYSVWRRGQDFFSVVGWAFNCSVLYPNRWQYWKKWLEFMLDLLEADLAERQRLDIENGQDEEMPLLKESILASYIGQRSGRSAGGIKWIMKAIFADGSKSSSSLFQEVWVKEHKGLTKNSMNKRKRQPVNIEKGDFGGFMDDDSVYSSQASEPPTPQKRRTNSGNMAQQETTDLEATFVESIPLRQRVFSLLSYLCYHLPDAPLDLSDLYQSFEATTKSLALPVFTAFIDSSTSALRMDSQISALVGIISLLMPSNALSPAKVDRKRHHAGGISPAILERCFLPYPANTIAVEDNAKVSLLLENLMQIIWREGEEDESFSNNLAAATGDGIQAREAKIKKKKTRARQNAEDPDAEARAVMNMSGQRLLMLVDLIDLGKDEEG